MMPLGKMKETRFPSRLLTVSEVAGQLRLHPMTIRRMLNRGQIRAFRLGRAIRIDPEAVATFLETSGRPGGSAGSLSSASPGHQPVHRGGRR